MSIVKQIYGLYVCMYIGAILPTRRRRRRQVLRWTFEPRSSICTQCNALMWVEERVANSSMRSPEFQLCCGNGHVGLSLLPITPAYLNNLLSTLAFQHHIRSYNSMFSFTSMGGKVDHSVTHTRGPYSFRISGENYHMIGSLLPPPGERPKYIQLYIHDTDNEIHNRVNTNTSEGSA